MKARRAVTTGALALLALLGAACAGNDNGGALDASGPTTSAAPIDLALVVAVKSTTHGDLTWSLTCQGGRAFGTGPFVDGANAAAVCTGILGDQSMLERLVHGPDRSQACTMQDGGPATAHVTGTLRGAAVDTTFTLHGGCEIADFQKFLGLVGPP